MKVLPTCAIAEKGVLGRSGTSVKPPGTMSASRDDPEDKLYGFSGGHGTCSSSVLMNFHSR